MTSAKTVSNIIFDQGGANELTVYTLFCEKFYTKITSKITPPQSTANYGSGPKDTKIIDLLRIEVRFTVRGMINSADESKIENLLNNGGVFKMTYKSTDFTINFEKLIITNDNQAESDETAINFTAIVGVNL